MLLGGREKRQLLLDDDVGTARLPTPLPAPLSPINIILPLLPLLPLLSLRRPVRALVLVLACRVVLVPALLLLLLLLLAPCPSLLLLLLAPPRLAATWLG